MKRFIPLALVLFSVPTFANEVEPVKGRFFCHLVSNFDQKLEIGFGDSGKRPACVQFYDDHGDGFWQHRHAHFNERSNKIITVYSIGLSKSISFPTDYKQMSQFQLIYKNETSPDWIFSCSFGN